MTVDIEKIFFLSEKLVEIIVQEGSVSPRVPLSVHETSCLGQDVGLEQDSGCLLQVC